MPSPQAARPPFVSCRRLLSQYICIYSSQLKGTKSVDMFGTVMIRTDKQPGRLIHRSRDSEAVGKPEIRRSNRTPVLVILIWFPWVLPKHKSCRASKFTASKYLQEFYSTETETFSFCPDFLVMNSSHDMHETKSVSLHVSTSEKLDRIW